MEDFLVGRSENAEIIDKGAIKVRNLLTKMTSSEDVSVSLIDLDGTNKKTLNKTHQAFYFVLEGEGVFNIDGEDHQVKEGDYVLIQPGTPYFDRGKMNLLAVSCPAFSPEDVEYLE